MENKEHIRDLLDKYREGLTSLEEEEFLKAFFASNKVPKEFLSEAHWFNNVQIQKFKEEDVIDLENKMEQWIDEQDSKQQKIRLRYWASGIAAGLAILVGTALFFQYQQSNKISDTYEDPQIAYLEAKKVLMYVSETFNHGTDKFQTVSRLEEGTNEMSIFSTFGSGLKNLELVSKYNDELTGKQ